MTYDIMIGKSPDDFLRNKFEATVKESTVNNVISTLLKFKNWNIYNGEQILDEQHVRKILDDNKWSNGNVSPFRIQFENEDDAILFRLMIDV